MSLAEFRGPDWKPSTEGGISRPKPRKNQRTRAGAGTKAAIRGAKCRECRLCGYTRDVEPHHIIPRGRQGRWEFDNIVGLCNTHHRLVTENDAPTLRALAAALTDGEYAYVIDELGEGALERLFGVGER